MRLQALAETTNGYTGAELESVCREAALAALREDIQVRIHEIQHFDQICAKWLPLDRCKSRARCGVIARPSIRHKCHQHATDDVCVSTLTAEHIP